MKHTYKVHQAMARREGHEKGTIPDPEEDDANDLGPVDDRTQVESLPGHLFDLAHAQEVDCLKVQVDARNKHDGQERVLLVRHNHLFNPAKPDLLEDCHCKIDVLIKKIFFFFSRRRSTTRTAVRHRKDWQMHNVGVALKLVGHHVVLVVCVLPPRGRDAVAIV